MQRFTRGMLTSAAAGFAATAGFLVLAGCGGGGGNGYGGGDTGGGDTRAQGTVNVYVTDGFREDWSQVLVTLYKIEASSDGGATYTSLYENADGQTLDLSSLSTAAQLLGGASVAAKDITQVRVTFGDTFTLTPKAGGASQTLPVDSTAPNVTVSGGRASVVLAAKTPVSAGRLSNLIVDFRLAAFELVGGKIRPVLARGDDDAFKNKDKVSHLEGTVSNLSDSGFDLGLPRPNDGPLKTVRVVRNADTVVTGPDRATVTLANNQRVTVEGPVDATTGYVTARFVQVRGDNSGNGPRDNAAMTVGVVLSVNAENKRFELKVREANGFRPSRGNILVQTNGDTQIQRGRDKVEFSAILPGAMVSVRGGAYSAETNTLAARLVLIRPNEMR